MRHSSGICLNRRAGVVADVARVSIAATTERVRTIPAQHRCKAVIGHCAVTSVWTAVERPAGRTDEVVGDLPVGVRTAKLYRHTSRIDVNRIVMHCHVIATGGLDAVVVRVLRDAQIMHIAILDDTVGVCLEPIGTTGHVEPPCSKSTEANRCRDRILCARNLAVLDDKVGAIVLDWLVGIGGDATVADSHIIGVDNDVAVDYIEVLNNRTVGVDGDSRTAVICQSCPRRHTSIGRVRVATRARVVDDIGHKSTFGNCDATCRRMGCSVIISDCQRDSIGAGSVVGM